MILSSLHLRQFRTYLDHQFEFDDKLTVIIGKNGSGKTNLLEAIYVLCRGQSFRDSEMHLLSYETDWWRLDGDIDGDSRSLTFQTQPTNLKQLSVAGGDKKRFMRGKQLPVVLFEPDQLLLIHGSPGSRRRYIDQVINNTDSTYQALLNRYDRILHQRNNVLKKHRLSNIEIDDLLFAWDVPLIDIGSKIAQIRHEYIRQLNQNLSEIYSEIAGKPQTLQLNYESELVNDSKSIESKFAALLKRSIIKDRERGFTSVGPHRDDIGLQLNGQDAATSASRGEVRSIIYSLKRRELILIEEASGSLPIFLMDDLYSELDESRQAAISRTLPNQTIITSVGAPGNVDSSQLIKL